MFKYLAFVLIYRLLGWLPTAAAYFIAARAATLVYYLRPRLRRNVQANIRVIMGPDTDPAQVRAKAKEAFRNLAFYYADLLQMPRLNVAKFYENNLTTHNLHYVLEAVSSGRGVVVASAHLGNPELVLQAAGAIGIRALGITEPLKPKRLSDFIHRLRESKGQTFRPVSLSTMKEALRWLSEGRAVSILCDRDIQRTGVPMPFLGHEVRLPVGAAHLALRTDAVLIPMFCRRTHGKHFEVYTEPPIEMTRTGNEAADALANTQKVVAYIEKYLRMDPGQWMVLDRFWEQPGREKSP
ncbi:MAG: lysophospholipid acyltransferase family protein [Dehalococcoidia bacterium]|nr:lysophospholipid acyltransferase family protein [Dehalococcoidia bacterium]